MSEWKDWYSSIDMRHQIKEDICSIDFDRLDRFAKAILIKYESEEEAWFYKDLSNKINILNLAFRETGYNTDFVWVIDELENEGLFEPSIESFMDFIKTVENMTGVQF